MTTVIIYDILGKLLMFEGATRAAWMKPWYPEFFFFFSNWFYKKSHPETNSGVNSPVRR